MMIWVALGVCRLRAAQQVQVRALARTPTLLIYSEIILLRHLLASRQLLGTCCSRMLCVCPHVCVLCIDSVNFVCYLHLIPTPFHIVVYKFQFLYHLDTSLLDDDDDISDDGDDGAQLLDM